jgi:hypothetical protein
MIQISRQCAAGIGTVFLFLQEGENRGRGMQSLPVVVEPSRQLFHFCRWKFFDGGFDLGYRGHGNNAATQNAQS